MKLNNRALAAATLIGTVMQLTMTTVGHANPDVKNLFAVVGMGISLIAGILYTVISTEVITRDNVVGGLIAGAVCAFIGIAVSFFLHDVPASILVIGTAMSAVTGALGGWVGRLFSSGRV
jgi:hypothetical protein